MMMMIPSYKEVGGELWLTLNPSAQTKLCIERQCIIQYIEAWTESILSTYDMYVSMRREDKV